MSSIAVDVGRFYDADYIPILQELITAIVHSEELIRDEFLVRRIVRIQGFQRAGNQTRNRAISVPIWQFAKSQEDVGVFFGPIEWQLRVGVYFVKIYPDDDRTVGNIAIWEYTDPNRRLTVT